MAELEGWQVGALESHSAERSTCVGATSLSIVITTFNRSAVLTRLLEGLVEQTDRSFQVVVAIDGSTDGTEDVLAKLTTPFELKVVNTHCTSYGLAVARNIGILAADGEAVAILDDDSFPEPGYVAAMKAAVTRGVITGGPRIPADDQNDRMKWKLAELLKVPPMEPMGISDFRRAWPNAYLVENNISMFRDDFIALGLFSERLKMYGFIGQEFFARADFFGIGYQFNHNASVIHHGEIAGDNGFSVRRKVWETRLAGILRPSLLRPRHFHAQVAWAAARANGQIGFMPNYRIRMCLTAPWYAFMQITRSAKRALKRFVFKSK